MIPWCTLPSAHVAMATASSSNCHESAMTLSDAFVLLPRLFSRAMEPAVISRHCQLISYKRTFSSNRLELMASFGGEYNLDLRSSSRRAGRAHCVVSGRSQNLSICQHLCGFACRGRAKAANHEATTCNDRGNDFPLQPSCREFLATVVSLPERYLC